jgi:hypothetical protein
MCCSGLNAISVLLVLTSCITAQNPFHQQVITLAPGDSTSFFFTNKTTAFYYGAARRLSASSHQGFNLSGQEYFEDYLLEFDGVPLDRRVAEVWIYPDRLKRRFSPQPIYEEVYLLDSLNVLAIKVVSTVPGTLDFIPTFSGSNRASDFEQSWQSDLGMLVLGQRSLINRQSEFFLPAWTAVFGQPAGSFIPFKEFSFSKFHCPEAPARRTFAAFARAPVFAQIFRNWTKPWRG